MRGKAIAERITTGKITGSPPPMRGKVLPGDPFQSFFGITPAYAGKSQIRSDLFGDDEGSPPPMRGKEDKTAEAK